ncbi:MAG TPA: bifunctional demethylmenaquinone methyltransferase/2-methoxy-6-polyprenyl-1,4-benzoquinol methylase UbiE [Opitutaceae bacterium]|nr:bifunctional demethylmenaquinone methyltransferase/2-methoxy-6-polyprenyl-1,4-benzoquinol methylase UbiE [Opitutaceae bacterium]
MPDSAAVNSMFGRIAGRYDLANRLLSGGRDVGWRQRLVAAAARGGPNDLLDLATGSGDVAFALERALPAARRIVGLDFCPPMLAEAERKRPAASRITFRQGDALALPWPDASFDAVTIAFGLRNLMDRGRGLAEMRRVLRPGGRALILEFSQPSGWFRPLYLAYLRHVLPRAAGLITRDRDAYVYLNETIESFPGREALAGEMRAAGFGAVSALPLTFGIVALHEGARVS